LTEEEKNRVEENGFKLDPNYEPMPSIGEMRIGFVHPQGPITPVEFNKLPIGEIAQKLRSDWSPEKLRERYKGDDFLRPHNAEGAGELLRNDFPKRLQDYVNNAGLFFERNVLDQHYTYSFLRGIQEAIKNNRELASEVNWSGIFELFRAIKEAGEKEVFARCKRERDSFDAWLAGWDTVHSGMSDVIQELLNERNGSTIIDFSNYRDRLLGIISYLLSYPDPTPKDEEGENAIISQRADSGEYVASDPFTIAINSVRGRTFQALVMFVHQDGKQLPKEDTVRISPDVKKLYETVLDKEDTRAIMFMFGHYLPTFYFCNKEWVLELLSKIFPEAPEKKYLFTAAWEGYLANNLFEEIFFNDAIQKLYERGLALTEAEYPKQKHFREPDESIAVHFALAYTHYENFDFDHPLLKKFWQEGAQDHHSHFISFIGRSLISSDNNRLAEAEKRGIKIRERIRALWDWMLENYKDPQPFEEFGFWVNVEKDIFEIRWLTERLKKTLQKTKGVVTWDYALTKSIVQLANEAPQDTLEIARWYLLEGGVRGGKRRRPLLLDREWFDAIKILYENIDTQSGTKALINDLICEGGSVFWKFKDILDDNKV